MSDTRWPVDLAAECFINRHAVEDVNTWDGDMIQAPTCHCSDWSAGSGRLLQLTSWLVREHAPAELSVTLPGSAIFRLRFLKVDQTNISDFPLVS